MTDEEKTQAKERIQAALKAASSLIVIETWVPPEHEFEKEARHLARERVQMMCIMAQEDLQLL